MNDGIPKFKLPFAAADHSDVAEILAAIAALGARVDAKLGDLATRLTGLERRLAAIEERLATTVP